MVEYIKQHRIDIGLLWLRVLMGLGIMTHGYRKIFSGNMDGFANGVADLGFPLPELFAWLAALSEFAGGWMLVLGLGTRIAAIFLIGTMFVAAFLQHAGDSFGTREKSLMYLTMAGTVGIIGPGKFSLDYLFGKYLRKKSK
ncbi:MAG: DoxX family protein [Candidatus Marinimicrobia bacterium]|nr:DoxX family protein [Candidatus Neomarinimicrobiota bacterium]MCF7827718.1 DoxX family protein [Candidatus Neomarinimicrobiota bacterium]MCF7881227.1 DoxX family protein [Candidatus Neomarinimicrobiota bacterium]